MQTDEQTILDVFDPHRRDLCVSPDAGTTGHFRETRHGWLMLAAVWLVCAAYLSLHLRDGWIPADAGMLGQEAERVLHGQVPFRDFNEVYTGGLTYLNALAIRMFGVNLFSIRIPLFLFFLGWVPAVYFIARRFTRPLAAGALTLLAVAWSVPNYPEAMPSWYNLFFATWGTLALLHHVESVGDPSQASPVAGPPIKCVRNRWLWIAGICGGLSIAVKITGLYFIAAGLLFCAFREQSVNARAAVDPSSRKRVYRPFLITCLLLFVVTLLDAVRQFPVPNSFVHFVLPGACVAGLLLWREYQQPRPSDRIRFRSLYSMALPFLAGAAMPVGILVLWYVHEAALRGFLHATFALSLRRMLWAAREPISPRFVFGLAPVLFLFLPARSQNKSRRWHGNWVAPIIFYSALLLAAWKSWAVYWLIGLPVPLVVPLLAISAFVWLRHIPAVPGARSEQAILIVTVAVLSALVQFPFGNPTYFNYVAPFVILALLALDSVHRRNSAGNRAIIALVTFYLLYAVCLATPGYFAAVGAHRRGIKMQSLALARAGGIRVVPEQARKYAQLIPLVQAHARGQFIYAAPNCPEVYFLSGLHNPTQTLYDFLDLDFPNSRVRTQRILHTIRSHNVTEIVLKDNSEFQGTIPAALRAIFDSEFPQEARVADFEVRWRP